MERTRPWLVLAICCTSIFLVGMDTTVVNIALPSIGHDLGLATSGLQWVVDAYTLVLASLLITSGALADKVGRRRVFRIGLVLFAIGSAACALAPTAGALVAARVVQGAGGSMLSPVALAIVVSAITDPRRRAQAIGVWASVFGLSMAAGPVVGGLLTGGPGWRTVFWVNLPIIAVVLVLTVFFVPESRSPAPRGLDLFGQLLLIVMVGSAVAALIEHPVFGVGTVVSVAVFVRYSLMAADPLMDLSLFRRPAFVAAIGSAVLVFVAFSVTLLVSSLYLQQERGLSPLDAGLVTLPMAVGATICPTISGFITGRIGPRMPLRIAGLCTAAGGILMIVSGNWFAYLLLGAGLGFANAPITNTAVSGLPPARSGMAGGLASTARQIGTALGIALAGGIAGSGDPVAGWVLVAGCGVVVAGVAGVVGSSGRTRREIAARA
ncbi:EmrB/QacA subfamily drug resistance transporter [Actinoplanes lutulentus]|uniref:EmrB/QacA subfamily drug resistance transporter n=1 Tax=Actinoplanes lutulentus TaxID=1287878 RepID=A0A327Z229_9ACTN|nr:MFS transporter [Actinoplanes lutulentus]MBB2940305.1 EmrB/QacA subfamily drug resistance transporter [Actinoplanes lutulentus]RAK28798.1 EmrB/QacA subfamily drug resistance transporter [Actinoplanes lutulentus]